HRGGDSDRREAHGAPGRRVVGRRSPTRAPAPAQDGRRGEEEPAGPGGGGGAVAAGAVRAEVEGGQGVVAGVGVRVRVAAGVGAVEAVAVLVDAVAERIVGAGPDRRVAVVAVLAAGD